MGTAKKQELTVEGKPVPVSNLDKVLYPATGFTKAQVIDYHVRVSPYLLPHLKDRPVTLKRYPDGVQAEHFYEKDAPSFTPDWVQTFRVPRRSSGGHIDYILINDLRTLVWCANLANLELHPFLHRVPDIRVPTAVVFDLDPGEDADVLTCAEVAFLLKAKLDGLKLESFPKVSGSKGMQVYVPLNTPVTYDQTQPFARTLAEGLAREHPDLIVAQMAKNLRGGKVFIDWSQNSDFKTTVGVYSLRAKREQPFVSMPVMWQELKRSQKAGTSDPLYFSPDAALARLSKKGDLFAPVLNLRQSLPADTLSASAPRRRARTVAKRAPKSLDTYEKKRDFSKTAEPTPVLPRRSRQGGRRRFVVQKHAASHLHYDFRLEMHDVLKSWAVPKGVPYSVEEKRLAMATEDHPIEYLDFEGTIPKGQYGGGTVMVWDIGTYEIIDGNYYKGKLHIFLSGKKLKGEWVLVEGGKDGKNWFLIKTGSGMKPLTPKQDDSSALTARSMAKIAEANDAQWHSDRPARDQLPPAAKQRLQKPAEAEAGERPPALPGLDLAKLPAAKLDFVAPMQCKPVSKLPEGTNWEYEIKLDGYRALALKADGRIILFSRNRNDLNSRFPEIAKACGRLQDGTLIDGEIVALDEAGRPSFNLLQNHQGSDLPIFYYAFDLLMFRGKSLLGVPLRDRRDALINAALIGTADPVRFSVSLTASATDLIKAAKEQGIEGLIAKRTDSVYEAGQRSGSWVKFKINRSQELVVGGYIPGAHHFDSLLVGYYETNKLIFIAKIRNGFVPKLRDQVYERIRPLETDVCPFANLPEPKNARRGEALTAAVMKKCRWMKPWLVAQIEFTEWTEADRLRHARFVALRDDKDPREVTHELTEEPPP